MHSFRDVADREWRLSLTLGSAKAVKDALGVDLLQPEQGDPPLLTRLGTDELLLAEVLCAMLTRQFEAAGITAEDVLISFDGRTILDAQTAFYGELMDFFRSRGRTERARAVAKQAEMIAAAVTAVEARIEALDVNATIDGLLSGDSQGPSGSTLDP